MRQTSFIQGARTTRVIVGLLSAICLSGGAMKAQASVTNAIWEADTTGQMVIQTFDKKVVPRAKQASFKNKTLLAMVLGRAATTNEKLAFNIDMANDKTNFYLSVYDQALRANEVRLTGGESTTLVTDGKTLAFTTEATLVTLTNVTTWGGGFVRIAGRGKMVNGVPADIKASVEGVFVDTRPGDLSGTTGILTRAKISLTPASPLRIEPPQPQN